jgi:hypothetical protein
MKKPYKNTDTSTKRCQDCRKPLKKNLVEKNPDAELCYRCWRPKELQRRGVAVNG